MRLITAIRPTQGIHSFSFICAKKFIIKWCMTTYGAYFKGHNVHKSHQYDPKLYFKLNVLVNLYFNCALNTGNFLIWRFWDYAWRYFYPPCAMGYKLSQINRLFSLKANRWIYCHEHEYPYLLKVLQLLKDSFLC